MEKKETGTQDFVKIKESLDAIEFLTKQYRRKRMTTEKYVESINENLTKLKTQRNYTDYLNRIGQN